MKKLISLTLTLAILLSSCFIVQVDAKEKYGGYRVQVSGDFKYILRDNDRVTITGYVGKEKNVTIPSEINGKIVRIIGSLAFQNDSWWGSEENRTLESVTIPDSVRKIYFGAFRKCVNLKEVNFGKNVMEIYKYAFEGCRSLTEFKIPPKVDKLWTGVLEGTGITSLHIGKNVTKFFGRSAWFVDNRVNEPLAKITVSKKNPSLSSKDGVLYNKKKTRLLLCPVSLDKKSLTIPSTVKRIEMSSFYGNKKLREVTLPDSLDEIEMGTFEYCKNLRKITIPKNVKRVGWSAFSGCKKLSEVNILNNKTVCTYSSFAGCGFESLEVTRAISSGYSGCENLKKITISPNLTRIKHKQFYHCPKLKTVTIPETVKKIGNKAFGYTYIQENGKWIDLKVEGFTIKGKKNSAAHKYAKENGFEFVKI